jgi:hypothetical protein
MAARHLDTTTAVMDALGGHPKVAILTNRKPKAAWNWYKFEHFPPDTYIVMTAALAERGCTAPPSLWRMVTPEPQV